MNVLEQFLRDVMDNATMNTDLLREIHKHMKELVVEDLFEITRIFVARKGEHVAKGFTLEQFKTEDPDGYFTKVMKGFGISMMSLAQSEVTISEREQIIKVLEKYKPKSEA